MESATQQQILESLANGSKRFAALEKMIEDNSKVSKECADQLKLLPELKQDIENTAAKVDEMKEMLEAWDTIKNVARFVKWMASLLAAFAVIWAAMKAGLLHER